MKDLVEKILNSNLEPELSYILLDICKKITDLELEKSKKVIDEWFNNDYDEWFNNNYNKADNKIVDKERYKKVSELAGSMWDDFKYILNKHRDTADVGCIIEAFCTNSGFVIGMFASDLTDESRLESYYASLIQIFRASFDVGFKFAQE